MMRKTVVSLIVLLAILAVGAGAGLKFAPCSPPIAFLSQAVLHRPATCPPPAVAAADAAQEVEPPAVTVATAARRDFVDRLFVSGTLVAREEADVSARIDGVSIVEIDAEDGDVVKAGQVLARLDKTQFEAQLAQNDAATARADAAIAQAKSLIVQAEAQVSQASDDFDRAKKLGGGVMSLSQIEQRETTMKTSTAQLAASENALTVAQADRRSRDAERRELQVKLSRTEVVAPVSGVVSRRTAKLGASVSMAGEPLFRIIRDGAIDLEAEVAEQALPKLVVGMIAKLKLPGLAGEVPAEVRLVNQEVDKASRTGKVRIALRDVRQARLGAFASGEVDLVERQGVGAPASALKIDGENAELMVVRDGRVEARKVEAGIVEGETVEIRDGLAAGETIIARAAAFLRPGDRVRAMPETVSGG
jgi:RND family efflux transporter MFP subunit